MDKRKRDTDQGSSCAKLPHHDASSFSKLLESSKFLIPHFTVVEVVEQWLKEDIPSIDCGGAVVGDVLSEATLYVKEKGVLAGCQFFDAVFELLDCKVEWHFSEGDVLEPTAKPLPPTKVAIVRGKANAILMGERLALNIIARASGIATKTKALVEIKQTRGWHGVVAGTRKTTPGMRLVEKQAMLVAGADPHRMDLSSMTMLKDNHVFSTGSITNAVRQAKALGGFSLKIEVECGSKEDAFEAIEAGADIVMLDNFKPADFKAVAKDLKASFPHILIEGSGGIREETIADYMSPDVDILSTSSIHQGVPHIDFSLKLTMTHPQ